MPNENDTSTDQNTSRPRPAPGSASAFDLEAVYDAEISPIMAQIIAICKRVEMPMLANFVYAKGRDKDDPEMVDQCTTTIPRGDWQTPEIIEAVKIIYEGASSRPKLTAFAITVKTPNADLRQDADSAAPPSCRKSRQKSSEQ